MQFCEICFWKKIAQWFIFQEHKESCFSCKICYLWPFYHSNGWKWQFSVIIASFKPQTQEIDIFFYFSKKFAQKEEKYARFGPELGSIPSRKRIFEQNLHKTRGSHMVFISCGTICDEKKIILVAAHPGVFLKPKNTSILMLFNI